jgi:hypothetical protein
MLFKKEYQQMRGFAWKVAFAALNPSPIFEAVARFAEKLPMRGGESSSTEINGASDLTLPTRNKQRNMLTVEDAPLEFPES